MAKDIINIPLYHDFKFYCLEFDAEVFHNRRLLFDPMTYFWEKIYCTYFNTKAKEYLRYLVDYTINCPFHNLDAFGITFLNEEEPQFRNSRIVYSKGDIIINRLSFDAKGRYVYKEHDLESTVSKLVSKGCNKVWAEDIVNCVNADEHKILMCLAGRSNGKEWMFLKSHFLTDDYIRHRLYKQGIKYQHITYDLMAMESLLIETTRKLKNKQI